MDSTSLFKTGHTIDETQTYRPSNILDTSALSNRILNGSFVQSPRIQNSYVQVLPPPMPIQTQPIILPAQQQRIPVMLPAAPPVPPIQIIQPPQMQQLPNNNLVSVYCPVCRRSYNHLQADIHAMAHDSTPYYNFRTISRSPIKVQPTPDKNVDKTKDTITPGSITSSQASSSRVQYPLVQPLEFWTKQLDVSAKNDIFIYTDNRNFDGVDRQLFKPPPPPPPVVVPPPVIQVKPVPTKPPLQYESNKTNLYNFMDNAVNAKNGPKFSFTDMCKNNQFVTPKRELQDWEIIKINQNQVRPPNIV